MACDGFPNQVFGRYLVDRAVSADHMELVPGLLANGAYPSEKALVALAHRPEVIATDGHCWPLSATSFHGLPGIATDDHSRHRLPMIATDCHLPLMVIDCH
jgi:hypothetical protein